MFSKMMLRLSVFAILLMVVDVVGLSADDADDKKKAQPYRFPTKLPNSRIHLDEILVGAVNKMPDPEKQMDHLISLLPTKPGKDRVLSFPQVSAVRLLGLTHSEKAAKPLVSVIEYRDIRDNHEPAPLALADLGEPAVEELVHFLKDAQNHAKAPLAARALSKIKGQKFKAFVESLKDKLPGESLKTLRLFVELQNLKRE